MYAKKNISYKVLVVLLCVVMLIGGIIGGTLAYLMTKTDPVINTFTSGNVDITLLESPISYGADGTVSYGAPAAAVANEYKLIPGTTYKKDPTVAVDEGSEDCFLFVKIEENEVNAIYLAYELNLDGWTQVPGETNVWYREVKKADSNRSFELIVDNEITIDTSVTSDTMDAAAEAELTFTAYAIQSANLDVEAAWAEVKNLA